MNDRDIARISGVAKQLQVKLGNATAIFDGEMAAPIEKALSEVRSAYELAAFIQDWINAIAQEAAEDKAKREEYLT